MVHATFGLLKTTESTVQRSQTGLLKSTRDMDAHTSLALPTNRERATDRLATGPEDAQERRQARARVHRVQRLASETAEEREIRLCRRRKRGNVGLQKVRKLGSTD